MGGIGEASRALGCPDHVSCQCGSGTSRYTTPYLLYTIDLGRLTYFFFFLTDDTKAKKADQQKIAGSAASRTRDPPVCTN